MSARRSIDVSHLPPIAYGSRSALWWGVVGMVTIEGMMFALLLAAHAYVALDDETLPPAPIDDPALLLPTLGLLLLLVSVLPMRWAELAARRKDDRGVRTWLQVATAIGLAILIVRVFELAALPVRWDSNAYGSTVWLLLGLHGGHVLASVLETAVLLALVMRQPLDDKHELDVQADGIYWSFVVVSWIPIYLAVYVAPLVL